MVHIWSLDERHSVHIMRSQFNLGWRDITPIFTAMHNVNLPLKTIRDDYNNRDKEGRSRAWAEHIIRQTYDTPQQQARARMTAGIQREAARLGINLNIVNNAPAPVIAGSAPPTTHPATTVVAPQTTITSSTSAPATAQALAVAPGSGHLVAGPVFVDPPPSGLPHHQQINASAAAVTTPLPTDPAIFPNHFGQMKESVAGRRALAELAYAPRPPGSFAAYVASRGKYGRPKVVFAGRPDIESASLPRGWMKRQHTPLLRTYGAGLCHRRM